MIRMKRFCLPYRWKRVKAPARCLNRCHQQLEVKVQTIDFRLSLRLHSKIYMPLNGWTKNTTTNLRRKTTTTIMSLSNACNEIGTSHLQSRSSVGPHILLNEVRTENRPRLMGFSPLKIWLKDVLRQHDWLKVIYFLVKARLRKQLQLFSLTNRKSTFMKGGQN